MGREYEAIDGHWRDWIVRQPVFFVGTAPRADHGHVNPHHDAWAQKKLSTGGPDALVDYQRQKNAASLDGLPAVEVRT